MDMDNVFQEFELEKNTRCTKCGDKNPRVVVEAIPVAMYHPDGGPLVSHEIIPGLTLSCLCESCRNEPRTFVLEKVEPVIQELEADVKSGGPLRFKVCEEVEE